MRSIKWSNRAIKDQVRILSYWVKTNGSTTYSAKIESETEKVIFRLLNNPFLGAKVKGRDNVRRMVIMHNYSLYYSFMDECIYIIAFWDNRQNPNQLNL